MSFVPRAMFFHRHVQVTIVDRVMSLGMSLAAKCSPDEMKRRLPTSASLGLHETPSLLFINGHSGVSVGTWTSSRR